MGGNTNGNTKGNLLLTNLHHRRRRQPDGADHHRRKRRLCRHSDEAKSRRLKSRDASTNQTGLDNRRT